MSTTTTQRIPASARARTQAPAASIEQPQSHQTPCVQDPHLYLVELDPANRHPGRIAQERARTLCQQRCPRFIECLSDALVGPDTAGFVAGTTPSDRVALRDAMNLTQRSVEVGQYNGEGPSHGQEVDYALMDQVIHDNPGATRAQIAEMVGCSATSVKRYLADPEKRRAKAQSAPQTTAPDEETLRAQYAQMRKERARLAPDTRLTTGQADREARKREKRAAHEARAKKAIARERKRLRQQRKDAAAAKKMLAATRGAATVSSPPSELPNAGWEQPQLNVVAS